MTPSLNPDVDKLYPLCLYLLLSLTKGLSVWLDLFLGATLVLSIFSIFCFSISLVSALIFGIFLLLFALYLVILFQLEKKKTRKRNRFLEIPS